jgi:hypothetical protein
MRFRTDNAYIAELKSLGKGYILVARWATVDEWLAVPPAKPGDTWRIHWHDNNAPNKQGPIAGYDILCTRCGKLHAWTTATNCATRRRLPDYVWTDERGEHRAEMWKCDHEGTGSCWTWTGSAENNTLSASPSLWSQQEKGGCGFHGHLTNGELSG